MDKRYLAIGVVAGVIALLLLFGSSQRADAGTYTTKYSATLSCNGPDGQYDPPYDGDNSCVASAPYFANAAGLTADIISHFEIPLALPHYSNFQYLATLNTPAGFTLAIDKEIDDGAAVGKVVLTTPLALFGGACTTVLVATIPMYDCITTGDNGTITWDGSINGENLLEGLAGNPPAGCTSYPKHLTDVIGNTQPPRARYFGATVISENMSPTQLQLVVFNPEQLRDVSLPASGIIDDLGYATVVVLDNPLVPAPAGDALDEICTPLSIDTTLWGKTGGEGGLTQQIGPLPSNPPPTSAGNFWTVADICPHGTGDKWCDTVRLTNPAANTGVHDPNTNIGTGSHLVGAYSESYRDADGDTIVNIADECPFNVDLGIDTNANFVDKVCDSLEGAVGFPACSAAHIQDCDGDGWRNQQDNCPLVFQVTQSVDTDGDRIGDPCDTVPAGGLGPTVPDGLYLNDMPVGSVCIGALDYDGDGWCDATEDITPTTSGQKLSDKGIITSVPEWRALDYALVAADPTTGAAPRTCDNYSYYSTDNLGSVPHGGVAPEVNDDEDLSGANAADPNCGSKKAAGDADVDGVPDASDNCINVWNPTQLDTDGGCTTAIPETAGQCGDACDTDDDNDNILDTVEWAQGSDAKNVCDPINFDTKPSGKISAADIVAFMLPLRLPNRPCNPPVNYNVCR